MNIQDTPNSSRIERKKEKTKQKIIAVAIRLFKEQGIDASTMEQIAEEVDIAKGTLYNYFPVKEAIIAEYIKQAFSEKNPGRINKLQEMPDTKSRMVLVLTELIKGVQAQKEIFERYLTYRTKNVVSLRKEESAKSGIERLSFEIIKLGQRNGEIREDLPMVLLQDLFEFVFVEVAKPFFLEPETYDARETIERCVSVFMNGVKDPNFNPNNKPVKEN